MSYQAQDDQFADHRKLYNYTQLHGELEYSSIPIQMLIDWV